MAEVGEASSSFPSNSSNEKPVIVRVKRKSFQSPLEAFWLEINERPLKRQLLDFGKLSISDSTVKDGLKAKRIFVEHVETVTSSEATIDVLRPFTTSSINSFKTKFEERRFAFEKGKKQDELLSRARKGHEILAKNARFEQLWKRRKRNQETIHDEALREICHLYDVVRVDIAEEKSKEMEKQEDTTLEENTILCNYLPLLRECVPTAAAEIESDMLAYISKQGFAARKDDYVYDLYSVKNDLNAIDEDALEPYPLVQVDEDDFYDGPIRSEYESDDSNDEDNPLNDYPDEETSEDEEEHQSGTHDESEEVDSRSASNKSEEPSGGAADWLEDDLSYGEEIYVDDVCGDDDGDEDWRRD